MEDLKHVGAMDVCGISSDSPPSESEEGLVEGYLPDEVDDASGLD